MAWASGQLSGPRGSQHRKADKHEVPCGVIPSSSTRSPPPSFRGKDLPQS